MPELPDVEFFGRQFDSQALNQTIAEVRVESESLLADISPKEFGAVLRHRRFESSEHYGKWLFLHLDNGKALAAHFGMTGKLVYYDSNQEKPRYTRMVIVFDNGHSLAYASRRKLGRVHLVDSPQAFVADKALGPDALSLSEEEFLQLAQSQRAGVKSWLMDQHMVAGIGNVYSDEILFQQGPALGVDHRHQIRCRS